MSVRNILISNALFNSFKNRTLLSLVFKLTQVFNNTTTTLRLTGCAHVAAMQNQPVVDINFELFWHYFFELFLNLNHIFTHSELGAIRYTIDVCVDSDCRPDNV